MRSLIQVTGVVYGVVKLCQGPSQPTLIPLNTIAASNQPNQPVVQEATAIEQNQAASGLRQRNSHPQAVDQVCSLVVFIILTNWDLTRMQDAGPIVSFSAAPSALTDEIPSAPATPSTVTTWPSRGLASPSPRISPFQTPATDHVSLPTPPLPISHVGTSEVATTNPDPDYSLTSFSPGSSPFSSGYSSVSSTSSLSYSDMEESTALSPSQYNTDRNVTSPNYRLANMTGASPPPRGELSHLSSPQLIGLASPNTFSALAPF